MVEMPLRELRRGDAARHGVEQAEDAIRAVAGLREHRAMHHLVQQHGEVEYREARHQRARQPEVPAVEVHDGRAGREQHREIGQREQRVQPRPLLVQAAQLFRGDLDGEIALELAGVIVVISHWTMKRVYTIGHSTRALEEFIALLREHGVKRLADIRRFPGSRRFPHFARDALEVSLPERGIEYVHIPELGGRRKANPDSTNTALQNEQFRAYADHMATDEFRRAVDGLLASGGEDDRPGRSVGAGETPALRTAVMCAEAVPWR